MDKALPLQFWGNLYCWARNEKSKRIWFLISGIARRPILMRKEDAKIKVTEGVLEKTLESTLDCKEIQSVYPRGNQSWIFIGRTHAEAESPIIWPPYAKSWLIRKEPDAGKDWGQEKMVRWHHWLNEHEFEQIPGDGEGQGSLMCCSPWGRKESDVTELLNSNRCSTVSVIRRLKFHWKLNIPPFWA